MFAMLQGGNCPANLYLFLAIYPLYDKENSETFESQFQCFLKFSQTVESTFNYIQCCIISFIENASCNVIFMQLHARKQFSRNGGINIRNTEEAVRGLQYPLGYFTDQSP